MEKIVSSQNKLVKSVKKLINDKKYRDATNLFVAESLRVINTLITAKTSCRNILISSSSKYMSMSKAWIQVGIKVDVLNDNIFESLTTLSTSDGLIAVFNKKHQQLQLATQKHYLVLDHLQNPGNLGTIIRTAVAFKIDGIIITNDSVDLFHPVIVRSTMGAMVNIPIMVITSLKDAIKSLKQLGLAVYGTALTPQALNFDQALTPNKNHNGLAVIFGNEGNGLNPSDLKLCDSIIQIPISNQVNSLNVAVACGIIMYQMQKK